MSVSYNIKADLRVDEVTEELEERIAKNLAKVCVQVQDDAKRECPVDTGRLQGSITYAVEGTEAAVGTNVEYAVFVHEGTSKMVGRPFLRNAIEKNRDDIIHMFEGLV